MRIEHDHILLSVEIICTYSTILLPLSEEIEDEVYHHVIQQTTPD